MLVVTGCMKRVSREKEDVFVIFTSGLTRPHSHLERCHLRARWIRNWRWRVTTSEIQSR